MRATARREATENADKAHRGVTSSMRSPSSIVAEHFEDGVAVTA